MSSRALRLGPTARVLAVAICMGVAALVVLPSVVGLPAVRPTPGWAWIPLLLVFLLAERSPVRIEMARSSHSMTMRDLPAVLGAVLLPPPVFVAVHLVGSVLPLLLRRPRMPYVKLAFNGGHMLAEAVLITAVVHAVAPAGRESVSRFLAAPLIAIVAAEILAILAVSAAVWAHTGRPDVSVLRETAWWGIAMAVSNASLGGVILVLLEVEPLALVLLALPILALHPFYRAHQRRRVDSQVLEGLERTSRALSLAVTSGAVVGPVLHAAHELLGCTVAILVVIDERGEPQAHHLGTGDEAGVSTLELSARLNILAGAMQARLFDSAHELQDSGDAGLVVPLRGAQLKGALILLGREEHRQPYGDRDLSLAELLGQQASFALEASFLVDEAREHAAQRERAAARDELTGLANRAELVTQADLLLEDPARECGVLLLDLVGFREVNDALGHDVGDQVLRGIAQRLVGLTPPGAVLARPAGDQFAILMANPAVEQRLQCLAAELQTALAAPLRVGDVSLLSHASIGISTAPAYGTSSATLLRSADVAMRRAKVTGAVWEMPGEIDPDASRERLALLADLGAALDAGDLEVWFQPQAQADSGRVVGVEALLRWQHPHRGFVSPELVVRLAQQSGRLHDLDRFVLHCALHQRQAWAQQGMELTVSVNVSVRSLLDDRLIETIRQGLHVTSTPGHLLTIEVTETDVMVDLDRSLAALYAIGALGVRLSVDDFGSGYSSLGYLRRLPVHEVKLDRSFLEGTGDRDKALVAATIDLVRAGGFTSVAEGVETTDTWEMLARMGCDLIQGYVLARPSPAEELFPSGGPRPSRPQRIADLVLPA